ncbi:hypothetical protein ACFSPA_14590 [Paracidovorax citrulli]|uniref:hypothetical protein n=1 Tax=Paracidovorax citrulli TaxID=80869 RepID=UPI0036265DD3
MELLVVISLLSLVMLAMASALRTTAQTEERVDARLRKVDDLRTIDGFLRSVLGRISLRKRPGITNVNENAYYFFGGPQEMVWVGIMPARYGVGGALLPAIGPGGRTCRPVARTPIPSLRGFARLAGLGTGRDLRAGVRRERI